MRCDRWTAFLPRLGNPEQGLRHVIAYSDPAAERRVVPGLLDDYAFTAIACLDAYEATADLSYFNFAQRIADKMVDRFFDPVAGGFFDTAANGTEKALGVLGTRRKPFQDSPTPAGNSVAAIALLRLYVIHQPAPDYREKAEQTLELAAGFAGKFGIFAATYGIAAVHLLQPHTQVVVIGEDALAKQLRAVATGSFAFGKSVLQLAAGKAVPQNLPAGSGGNDTALARNQGGKNGGDCLLRIQLPAADHGSRTAETEPEPARPRGNPIQPAKKLG